MFWQRWTEDAGGVITVTTEADLRAQLAWLNESATTGQPAPGSVELEAHRSQCCARCGCVFDDKACPVIAGRVKATKHCADCEHDGVNPEEWADEKSAMETLTEERVRRIARQVLREWVISVQASVGGDTQTAPTARNMLDALGTKAGKSAEKPNAYNEVPRAELAAAGSNVSPEGMERAHAADAKMSRACWSLHHGACRGNGCSCRCHEGAGK